MVTELAAYIQLMEQGYSTREAPRTIGTNLRTGKKWRSGHQSPGKGLKPVPPSVGQQADQEEPAARSLVGHDD